jgi:hypothetical protein
MSLRLLSVALGSILCACGGLAIETQDASDDAGPYGREPDGALSGDSNTYVDPKCPEAGAPQTEIDCNIYDPNSCPQGAACYPGDIPPEHECESEVYGEFCLQVGAGTQGAACDNTAGCAAGFVCLITGATTQCARDCDLDGPHGCDDGFVCEPIDIPGFAACL